MRYFIYGLIFSMLACTGSRPMARENEWISLFNGKDLQDWTVKVHHHEFGMNFGNTFRAEEGMIKVRYDQYGDFNDQFAHLYYKEPLSYFHLALDYRFAGEQQKGAPSYTLLNSGVMFHAQDPRSILKEQDWPISVEMQFLAGLGDGQPRPTGNMCSPGTEIVYQGKKYNGHCLNSTSKTYDRNEWVHAELIVLGDSLITHVINGDTVLQYSQPSMGGGFVKGFDATVFKPAVPLRSGYIALQSEGHPIDFKNIRLKRLR
jgi:hypothetical protein